MIHGHIGVWLKLALLLSVLVGVGLWVADRRSKSPQEAAREALEIQLSEVRAAGAEGSYLAEQLSAGRLTRPFLLVETRKLREKVDPAIQELGKLGREPGMAAPATAVSSLARGVRRDLDRLEDASPDLQRAAALRHDFDRVVARMVRLEDALEQ